MSTAAGNNSKAPALGKRERVCPDTETNGGTGSFQNSPEPGYSWGRGAVTQIVARSTRWSTTSAQARLVSAA